jgi:BirA family transcriptional regulator, biotin operon repressor / biotin---[acetyl-CoA-carboxylase] ligase
VLRAVYPPEVRGRATSIEVELGRPVDRALVLAECLAALSSRYRDLRTGREGDVLAGWRARAASTMGRRVEWDSAGGVLTGLAERVDDDGALLVRTETGLVRILSGEVRWTP